LFTTILLALRNGHHGITLNSDNGVGRAAAEIGGRPARGFGAGTHPSLGETRPTPARLSGRRLAAKERWKREDSMLRLRGAYYLRVLGIGFVLVGLTAGVSLSQSSELLSLNSRVKELYDAGSYQEALHLAEKAVRLDVDSLPLHVTALLNLARINRQLNHFDEAKGFFERALASRVSALGEGHHEVAETRNELALFYRSSGRYADAESLLKQALDVYGRTPAHDFRDEVFTLDILTGLYRYHMGRLKEAERLSNRALAIRTRELEPNDRDIAQNRASLALLYRDQGRYSEAEPLLKSALATYEKILAPDDDDIVDILDI